MSESPVYVRGGTPEFLEAFEKARVTFKYFWRELSWEHRRIIPGLDLACVKVAFRQENPPGDPIVEYMWISDVDFDGVQVTGTLINDPDELTNVSSGDSVQISWSEICDWMFAINRKVYGGYTIQVIRAGLPKKDRKAHDKAWGLDFGGLDNVMVAYEQDKHPENLIEHPMCRNMGDSFRDFLTQHPTEVTQCDEDGYTMLHRQAIAGNRGTIEILLELGADPHARTTSGYTAGDFASALGWDHLVPLLS